MLRLPGVPPPNISYEPLPIFLTIWHDAFPTHICCAFANESVYGASGALSIPMPRPGKCRQSCSAATSPAPPPVDDSAGAAFAAAAAAGFGQLQPSDPAPVNAEAANKVLLSESYQDLDCVRPGDSNIALANNPRLFSDVRWKPTQAPPLLSPNIVTRFCDVIKDCAVVSMPEAAYLAADSREPGTPERNSGTASSILDSTKYTVCVCGGRVVWG